MQHLIKIFLIIVIISTCASADDQPILPIRPAHTFSIVCYDPATGQFGAAVQSHWFKVADVIWLEAGVGAVATQSLTEFSYGPLGLAMMRNGKSAQQALEGLLVSDPDNAVRQVAMIDRNGIVATHTGGKCIAEAGHQTGKNYSVQANLMRHATVWPAMAKAFESTEGDLADKMMAALEAAQNEGGDIRGKQSAALVVASGTYTGMPWKDRLIDIRVDDSPEPLKELRRLLNISRAYEHMDKGDLYITDGNFAKAKEEYMKASEMASGNPEVLFWYAATLVSAGEVDSSLPIFKQVFQIDESWRELVPRLVKAELLPDDKAIIDRIIKQ
ncbi:MAG: DUF1028 domain-containing protein [Candidatus Zixiibacteriota bacterium]